MKNRSQKYIICLFVCVLLCASFLALPVSAADVYTERVTWNNEYPENTDLFRIAPLDVDTSNIFETLDSSEFDFLDEAISATSAFDQNDKRYTEFTFRTPVLSTGGAFVASYNINYVLESYFEDTGNFLLKSSGFTLDPGSLSAFITSSNSDIYYQITGIRFSLRNVDVSSYIVGEMFAATDFIPADLILNTASSVSDTIQFDNLRFYQTTLPPSPFLALCVDFVGVSDSLFNRLAFYQPDFYLNVHKDGIGPLFPQYTPPSFEEYEEYQAIEQDLLDFTADSRDTLSDLISVLPNRMMSFAKFFSKLAILLTDVTGSIPFFDVIVYISLSLGLYASLLGIASGLTMAAQRSHAAKEREFAESEKKRYEDWLVTHYQRKEK